MYLYLLDGFVYDSSNRFWRLATLGLVVSDPSGFIVTCCEPLGSDSAGDQFSYQLNILTVSL